MAITTFPTAALEDGGARAASIDALPEIVESVRERLLAPGARDPLALGGRTALLHVRVGVLALAAPDEGSIRALPGEWIRVAGIDEICCVNGSRAEPLSILEIQFDTTVEGAPLGVESRYFTDDEKANSLCLVAAGDGSVPTSGDGHGGALDLGLAARVYLTALGRWETVLHDLPAGRTALVSVLGGDASINGEELECGESAAIVDDSELRISGGRGAEVLLLELPASGANGDRQKMSCDNG